MFEVDTFASKMGDDEDVCVMSLQVKDRAPARDLMEFIEKSFNFVLDADVSAGENDVGEYSVFIEMARTPDLILQMQDLAYGIKRLTGIAKFEFRHHKDKTVRPFNEEQLKEMVPLTPGAYRRHMRLRKQATVKEFFNRTVMSDLVLEDDDTITIHKPYGQTIQLKIVEENNPEAILENNSGPEVTDVDAMSEVFWLTKVLGDYKINKLGENFLFINNNRAMLLQRV
jgi:hypothetical protein